MLALQRQELAGREPADKVLAVLADPVLRGDDPRVRHAARTAGEPTSAQLMTQLDKSTEEMGMPRFERLPFTRHEADTIAAFVGQPQRLTAVDFDAR